MKDEPTLEDLAHATYDVHAVQQFYQFVTAARDPDTGLWNIYHPSDLQQRITQLLRCIRNSESHKLLRRLFTARLAKEIDASKQGMLQTDSATLRKAEQELKITKEQQRSYLTEGRKWNRLASDDLDGLLCLIPLTSYRYQNITTEDVPDFHKHLGGDALQSLLESARRFQASLDMGPNVVFRWEVKKDQVIDWTRPLCDILDDFRPCPPALLEDVVPEGWLQKWPDPAPLDWPAELSWPADILRAIPGKQWCDACKAGSGVCRCYDSTLPEPRICRYPGKGLGLQAVGQTAGQVVYRKNARIGFLNGHIVPYETYKDSWTMELEKFRCQIHYEAAGNIFKFLNHSCDPVAKVRLKLLSGRRRLEVVALKHIHDRSEITIDYGKAWDASKCLCGSEHCRSKGGDISSEDELSSADEADGGN